MKSKTKVSYIGAKIFKNEKILEIGILLKHSYTFLFIPIDDKNVRLDEIEYLIDKEKYLIAMVNSTTDDKEIKQLIKNALTDKIDDR